MTRGSAVALAAAALLVTACRSVPTAVVVLPHDDPSVVRALEGLRAVEASRHSLRASARVSLSGSAGASFARHLLILERPARLRLEVLGLVGQRVAVLASDGEAYDLYRAETGRVESGVVTSELLGEVAGVPLAGRELVALLLGLPPNDLPPPDRTILGADGRLALHWRGAAGGGQDVVLDAAGRLVAVRIVGTGGHEQVAVTYADHSEAEGFAQQVHFDFGSVGLHAEVSFRRWELDPELPSGLFRLDPVSSPGG